MSLEVKKWLKDMSPLFLRCRSIRHAWDVKGYSEVDPPESATALGLNQFIGRQMQCVHCEVIRTDIFGRRRTSAPAMFRKLTVRYRYPGGYQYSSKEMVGTRPTMQVYDNESLARTLPAELQ